MTAHTARERLMSDLTRAHHEIKTSTIMPTVAETCQHLTLQQQQQQLFQVAATYWDHYLSEIVVQPHSRAIVALLQPRSGGPERHAYQIRIEPAGDVTVEPLENSPTPHLHRWHFLPVLALVLALICIMII